MDDEEGFFLGADFLVIAVQQVGFDLIGDGFFGRESSGDAGGQGIVCQHLCIAFYRW